MGFVIYVSSETNPIKQAANAYGYYQGKTYRKNGILYPVAYDHKITSETKIYTSKKRAETAAEKLENCAYVLATIIEEV